MPINNPVPLPASVGIIRFSTIDSSDAANAGKAGYWDFHDGKWITLSSNSHRTIGNIGSGANIAQSWLFKLFENIYEAFNLPIYTSTGQVSSKSNVISDWNAGKRLALPDFRGRTMIGDGTGQAGIYRSRGTLMGAETHALNAVELATHTHSYADIQYVGTGGNITISSGTAWNYATGNTTSVGSSLPHNNMQPSIVIPVWISAGMF